MALTVGFQILICLLGATMMKILTNTRGKLSWMMRSSMSHLPLDVGVYAHALVTKFNSAEFSFEMSWNSIFPPFCNTLLITKEGTNFSRIWSLIIHYSASMEIWNYVAWRPTFYRIWCSCVDEVFPHAPWWSHKSILRKSSWLCGAWLSSVRLLSPRSVL